MQSDKNLNEISTRKTLKFCKVSWSGCMNECNIVLERTVAEHLFHVRIEDVVPPSEEEKNHKDYKNLKTHLPGQL